MNVIVCGAGQVGTHTAEVLSQAGHNVTVIDQRADRLTTIEDRMDVGTLLGNGADAEVLRKAGLSDQTALVAATNSDEVNMLTAFVGRQLGVDKTVVRVHHGTYLNNKTFNYTKLGIDRLICPEHATAEAVGSLLRNPAAMAIENFASSQVEMQEFTVTFGAAAAGKRLVDLGLPDRVRLAAIIRGCEAFLPTGQTEILPGDVVVLLGNKEVFQAGRAIFQKSEQKRRRLVMLGGPSMAVWLCRALRDRAVAIRLFEHDRQRAEELADKLDWVTVLNADPTDPMVFEEEGIADADAYVALSPDDERNILACAWAKRAGVRQTIAVVEQLSYLHLMEYVGVDHAFSPRAVAAREIIRSLDRREVSQLARLSEGGLDLCQVHVPNGSAMIGLPLRQLPPTSQWRIGAIQHGDRTYVPTADDMIHAGDTVLVIAKEGQEVELRQAFAAE